MVVKAQDQRSLHFAMRMDIDKTIVEKYLNPYFPTKKDLKRKLQPDELMELCLRISCKVNLSRWNIVADCDNRTKTSNQGIVHSKIKKTLKDQNYTQKEIDKVRKQEWAERRKRNLIKLAIWKHEKKEQAKKKSNKLKAEKDKDRNEIKTCKSRKKPMEDISIRQNSNPDSSDSSMDDEIVKKYLNVKTSLMPIETPLRRKLPIELYTVFSPTVYTEDYYASKDVPATQK